MSRGPKRTPAAVKKDRGTYRKDRDAGLELAAGSVGDPPDRLHPKAAEQWRKLVALLAPLGVLTPADAIAWELGLSAYSEWLDATANLTELYVETEKGYPVQHPLVAIRNKSWQDVLKFCREFGLTPSSRNGLIIPAAAGKPDDPLEAHAAGGE